MFDIAARIIVAVAGLLNYASEKTATNGLLVLILLAVVFLDGDR